MRIVGILLGLFVLLTAVGMLPGCSSEDTDFSIRLTDSGEVVLTDKYFKSYDWQTHTIELTEKGIQRWNSYHTYETIPKLNQTLFGKEFVAKLGGKELYQGKLYSLASSASYSGVVILEALFKLDSDPNTISGNTIQIDFGYPVAGFGAGEDPRNNSELKEYLEKRGILN